MRNVQDVNEDLSPGAGWTDTRRAGRPIVIIVSMNADYTVEAVSAVDTTGCGDAFMGAVLAGLSAG